jgi:superfamily II RNA helicase
LESDEILTRISTKKEKIKEYGRKRSMLDKNLCGEQEFDHKFEKYNNQIEKEEEDLSKPEIKYEKLMNDARKQSKEYAEEF